MSGYRIVKFKIIKEKKKILKACKREYSTYKGARIQFTLNPGTLELAETAAEPSKYLELH